MQQHLLVAAATVDPSPAFQSRGSSHIVVLVAERRLTPICKINRRSATENGYALVDPALKSRAKLTWSLRDREDGCCIYFSKTINPRDGWRIFPRRVSDGRIQSSLTRRGMKITPTAKFRRRIAARRHNPFSITNTPAKHPLPHTAARVEPRSWLRPGRDSTLQAGERFARRLRRRRPRFPNNPAAGRS
jgi:hypothetical protein